MAYFLRFCAGEATSKCNWLGNPIAHNHPLGHNRLASRFDDHWLIGVGNGNIALERSERFNPLTDTNAILRQNPITFHCTQSRNMRMKHPTIKIAFELLDKGAMIDLATVIRMIQVQMSTTDIGRVSVTDFHA